MPQVLPNIPTDFLRTVLSDRATDTLNVVLTAIDNQLLQTFQKQQLLPLGFSTQVNLRRYLTDQARQQAALREFAKAEVEKNPYSIIDGLLVLFGVDPKKIRESDKQNLFKQVLPQLRVLVYRFLGPEVYDQIYGHEGSKAILSKALLEVYYPYGVSPEQVDRFTEALTKAFKVSPQLRYNYSNESVARIIELFTRKGLMPLTTDLSKFTENALAAVGIYRAIEDSLSLVKPPDQITIQDVEQILDNLVARHPGMELPTLHKLFLTEEAIRTRYPFGTFQAAIQATGVPLPAMVQTPEGVTGYAILDSALAEQNIRSPVGTLVGATVRAVERMGAKGPLKDLYESFLAGKAVPISFEKWVNMAVRSGISRRDAIALLHQSEANQAVLKSNPVWPRVLRILSYHYDLAPKLRKIYRSNANPEVIRGELAEMAKRLGYRSVGSLDAGQVMLVMNSPLVNQKALEVLYAAMREAKHSQESPPTYMPPLRRLSQFVIERAVGEPRMTVREMLNVVDPKQVLNEEYRQIRSQFGPFGYTPTPRQLLENPAVLQLMSSLQQGQTPPQQMPAASNQKIPELQAIQEQGA